MSRPSCTRFVKFIRKGVADCHSITAVSTSAYSDSDGNYQGNANAVVKFDDTVILDGANRGITMYVLNASTGEILYNYNFDTYGDSDTNSAGLVTALDSYKEAVNTVLVLVSQDAIALTEEVIEALRSYGGGVMNAVTTPARAAFAFIGQGGVPSGRAYYEVRAYEKATVSLQASVTNGVLIQRGADGADAVTVIGSGEDIVFTKVGQIAKVYVDAYKGQKQIAYQDDFYCSAFSSSLFDGAVGWGFSTDGDRFFYYFKLRKQTDLNGELTYTATVNSVEYKRVIRISTAFDGERGPALRGPQAWSDCAVGYSFYAGGDGEEWKDVVLYDGNYYSCVTSHTKTADNYPTSSKDTANGYWKLADTFELVATKILLSQYALVKNLGVETIDMKDSDGNVLFQAKDGNVICKTGTFENIVVNNGKVSGTLIAALYYGKTREITEVTYSIDPNEEPYNCYLINEPTKKQYIILPKASEYDGLELSFFIKNSNWGYDKNTTYIKASGSPEMLYVKKNIYNIVSGTSIEHTLEDFNAEYTGDDGYWMMQPNMLIKFKSMFGDWYCTDGLWTGE